MYGISWEKQAVDEIIAQEEKCDSDEWSDDWKCPCDGRHLDLMHSIGEPGIFWQYCDFCGWESEAHYLP